MSKKIEKEFISLITYAETGFFKRVISDNNRGIETRFLEFLDVSNCPVFLGSVVFRIRGG
jgi:hypothetical protein